MMSIPRLVMKKIVDAAKKNLAHTHKTQCAEVPSMQQKFFNRFQRARQIYSNQKRNINGNESASPYSLKRTAGAGILLFSLTALSSTYAYTKHEEEIQPKYKAEITTPSKQLISLVERLYPSQYKIVLQVYEALDLTLLLNLKLSKASISDELNVLNDTLQEILLRPKNVQRYQLNDTEYLKIVSEKLNNAYQKENIDRHAVINAAKLKVLLLQESLWVDSHNPHLKIDAALIMGSTYQEYLNRQNFFFNLISSNKILLNKDRNGNFPVYLLEGDRPLHKEMDMGIIPFMQEHRLTLTEQNMMDWMFDETLKKSKFSVNLKRISTASPNESEGRPTTAGTLISALSMLRDEQSVLMISSAPFIRYQRLVTERLFLKHNKEMQIIAEGPDLKTALITHPNLAKTSCIAICLDNLARETYEMKEIAELKAKDLHKLWVR